MAARAQGEDELAELLSHTRISTGMGVSVELALPQAILQKHLEDMCRLHHAERRWVEEQETDPAEGEELVEVEQDETGD